MAGMSCEEEGAPGAPFYRAGEGRSGLRRTKVRGGVFGEIRGIRAKKERGEAEMDAA